MQSDRKSLSQRLMVSLLLPALLLAGLLAVAAYFVVLRFANIAYDRALDDGVLTLAAQVRIDNGNVLIDLPPAARKMLEFDEVDHVYYSVVDTSDHLLAGNFNIPATRHFSYTSPNGSRFYNATINGEAVRVAEYSESDALQQARTQPKLYIRVAETLVKRQIMAREVFTFMLIPVIGFVAAMAGLIWYGINRGLAPLHAVRVAIASRSHKDLSPLDETFGPAEVHEQVHAINALMLRLSTALGTQRRFIADAAHQLRTPIAAIKAQAELALKQKRSEEILPLTHNIQASAARLARLANQLLNLSRAEHGALQDLTSAPLSISDLLEDVLAEAIPAALAKNIEVSLESSDNIPVLHGDRQLLGEMLANLFDNAIRYTQPGGCIWATLGLTGNTVRISVEDNGPGISPDEQERVFERFYRVDGSLSEGSGLGLPIAREIAILHGGHIQLGASASGSGLVVEVTLPLSAATSA